MKRISLKNAVKVFYYLIAADGIIADDELQKLSEIGNTIDNADYPLYSDELISECASAVEKAKGEDYYDIIQECTDEALICSEITENSISARMLLWNLITVAYADGSCSDEEKRMMKHIARKLDIEQDIYLEMQEMMRSALNIQKERSMLEKSDKPYSLVKPMIDELDKRLENIIKNVDCLIEDEEELDDPYIADNKKDFINEAGAKIAETAGNVVNSVGEFAAGAVNGVGDFFVGLFANKTQTAENEQKGE